MTKQTDRHPVTALFLTMLTKKDGGTPYSSNGAETRTRIEARRTDEADYDDWERNLHLRLRRIVAAGLIFLTPSNVATLDLPVHARLKIEANLVVYIETAKNLTISKSGDLVVRGAIDEGRGGYTLRVCENATCKKRFKPRSNCQKVCGEICKRSIVSKRNAQRYQDAKASRVAQAGAALD